MITYLPHRRGAFQGGGDNELLTDLVSYWKLDEFSDGTSAVTRSDSHGSNDLTDNNTTASGTGIINNGADFEDTTNEYLSVADNASLSITGALTISTWVRLESLVPASGFYPVVGKYNFSSGDNRSYQLFIQENEYLQFSLTPDGTAGSVASVQYASALSTATWYHVVAVYVPSTSVTLYLDGTQVAQNTTSIPATIDDNNSDFMIGSWGDATTYHFDGLIDETCIYQRALSATEVSTLYNSGNGLPYSSFE